MSQQVKERQAYRVLSLISELENSHLIELSIRRNRSRSFLLREALQQYLANQS